MRNFTTREGRALRSWLMDQKVWRGDCSCSCDTENRPLLDALAKICFDVETNYDIPLFLEEDD